MRRFLQQAMRTLFKKGGKFLTGSDEGLQRIQKAWKATKASSKTRKATADALMDIGAKFGDVDPSVKLTESQVKGISDIITHYGLDYSDEMSEVVSDVAVNLSRNRKGESYSFVNAIKEAATGNARRKVNGVTKDFVDETNATLTDHGKNYFRNMGMDDTRIAHMENKIFDMATDPTRTRPISEMSPHIMMNELKDMKYSTELNKVIARHANEIGINPTLYKKSRIGDDGVDVLDDLHAAFDAGDVKYKEAALRRSHPVIKSGRNAMGMRQPEPGAIEKLLSSGSTLDTKVDKAIQIAMESGNVNAALHTMNFDKMLKYTAAASSHSRGMLKYATSQVNKLDDAQDIVLKIYTINRGRNGRKLYKISHNNKPLDVDLEAIAAIKQKKTFKTPDGKVVPVSDETLQAIGGKEGQHFRHIDGDAMDYDIAALSNRMTNINRRLMKYQKEAQFGRPEAISMLTEDPRHIPDTHIEFRGKRFSTDTIGDLGENYIPMQITDAFRQVLEKNDVKDYNAFGALDGTSSLESSRKAHSLMEAQPWRTKRLAESINSYSYKYGSSLEKGLTTESLNTAEAAYALSDQFISPQMAHTGSTMRGAQNQTQIFRNIRRHLQTILDTRTTAASGDSFIAEMSRPAARLITNYAHINKSVLLSGGKLAFFNRFQPFSMRFTNENIGKSFVDNLGGVMVSDTRMARNIFKKGTVKATLKQLKANKKLTAKQRYVVGNYFDTYMIDLTAASIHLNESKFAQKVGDFITLPFTSGDISSRYAVARTAQHNLDDVLRKYAGDPARIRKEAAIDALNYQDQNRIMAALKRSDFQIANKEAASLYTNAVINKKLFNYGKFGKPEIVDAARKNPLAALAVTFTTWPMYWGNTMRTVMRAAKDGNKKPLQRMVTIAGTWWAAAGLAYNAAEDEDGAFGDMLQGATGYAVKRTPMFSPVSGALQILNRPVAGVGADMVGTLNFMINYSMGESQKKLMGTTDRPNEYTINHSYEKMKSSGLTTRAEDLYDLWGDLK